ncbi:TrmB family transcriptional regulator sugar-binding domain-containing protein [Natrinema versiforme]|uniref:TrmB family transcriptional regulator n=1 Tax=Natrinema versiforme TaxID=88724 RepID=A0A4P8WSI6_9EURY|nr:TrmB family transcriptional regulator sugar-binding domain-containing protein [Natrinema versiforme]QCS45011.1 TrmB family transcriptional regulator [Natrinema versiforme]
MDEKVIKSQLSVFGFSEKEINTYLALLPLGEAKTSVIADEAEVSQRYVYQTAETLEERGLVTVKDHAKPTTIAAVDPEQAIEGLVGHLRSIQTDLEERFSEDRKQSASFEVLKSRSTVLKKIRRILASAEKEAFITMPNYIVTKIESDIAAAVDRGASVWLLEGAIVPQDPGEAERRFDGLAHVVRQVEPDIPFVVTSDSGAGIVGQRTQLKDDQNDLQSVMVSQTDLVGSLFGSFQGGYWSAGEEVFASIPKTPPATFTTMRPAVTVAALCQQKRRPLRVEANGTNPETDEPLSVEGRVIDVRQRLVEPFNNSFPLENTITVETDDERVNIGGEGAFMEDISAEEITLLPIE